MSITRVTFVCQWYPPEPVSVPPGIVSGLASGGFKVEVLTGVPNYPTGVVASGYSPTRRSTEVIDGVRVNRTPLYPSHDASAARRLLNYASWAFSSTILGQRVLRASDVALVYSSPATSALPAMVAKRLWGTPYVLLIQDVWPDSVFASGFLSGPTSKVAKWILDQFVGRTYALADHVAVISPGMVNLLAARGVPREKVSVVYNWADEGWESVIDPGGASAFRTSLGLAEADFLLMYAGNHGKAQALGSVVDAFALLSPEARCHLVLVGDGMEKQALKSRAAGNPRVHFVDPEPIETMRVLMTVADAQLVSLADRGLFAVTMPSKVQSILAAGLPIVVSARGDSAAVVREAGAGVVVAPENPSALAAAVQGLAGRPDSEVREMGMRGRAYYDAVMSRGVGLAALRELLLSASKAGAGGPPQSLDRAGANTLDSTEGIHS